ncbi:MAG: hypothetical protein HOO95_05555 [Gallionella sp.]|nr:hypothetical protein [Gallionella sp.]
MKKWHALLIVAIATSLLNGCLDNGSPADPPAGMTAQPGDGRVKVDWTPNSGIEYWLFTATDAALTAFNWTGLANSHVYINAHPPFYVCGLFNDTPYYFAANGRVNGGSGGSSSTTISGTPYNASSTTWVTSSVSTTVTPSLNGVGYTSLTTCSNNATSASGSFATVGTGGAVFTSTDGKIWNTPTWQTPASLPPAFDLYAVTGYTANQNNTVTPALRWVAVGSGGASVYSTDGSNWNIGRDNLGNPSLRAITQVAGTFWAVGDALSGGAATILSSTDGITWTAHTSGSTNNLRGIIHGSNYVAVGDNGTILTSADGNTWATQSTVATRIPTINLNHVTANGNIIVVTGDGGTIVTSKDAGVTWTIQTLLGTPNLVGIATESQYLANAIADTQLGFIANAQFVAIDSVGNYYTSPNGLTWSAAKNMTGVSSLNSLVSSGFGYVAVGNAGVTASVF